MSEARKLRNLALDMRFECERVPIAAVSRRPQVCGLEVPAYAIETHDAAVVAWCAYRLEGGALDLYAWKELQFHGGRRGEETQIVSGQRKETP